MLSNYKWSPSHCLQTWQTEGINFPRGKLSNCGRTVPLPSLSLHEIFDLDRYKHLVWGEKIPNTEERKSLPQTSSSYSGIHLTGGRLFPVVKMQTFLDNYINNKHYQLGFKYFAFKVINEYLFSGI